MTKTSKIFLKLFKQVFVIICLCSLGFIQSANSEQVDLELVLAMDASGSISEKEYLLQVRGTAAAFRDPQIIQAIQSGPTGKIAVAVMLWSDASNPKEKSNWFILKDDASISQFANFMQTFQINDDDTLNMGGGGGTGIGSGVEEAIDMINRNSLDGLRKVVDISGDGIETEFSFSKGIMMRDAKLIAVTNNVTVNGLPILGEDYPYLDQYYREEVIIGPGSFVVTAKNFEDFGRAIQEKLLREIRSNVASLSAFDETEIASKN